MGNAAKDESADAVVYRKKLAVAQGEIEGYRCKVEGFRHALEELEMQLVEKDLQVAMLKSVIVDADNPASVEFRLIEALELNRQLQQKLQQVTAQLAAANAAVAAATTPRPAQQQHRKRWHDATPGSSSNDMQQRDCQSTQLLMLRKALTAANMSLTSNGLLPVAATSDLLQAQDLIDSWPGDQGVAFASYAAAQATAAPSSNCRDRAVSPALGLPALSLFSKLSAVSEDGTGTPLSGTGERFLHNSSRCSTPADDITPGRPASNGSDLAADAACIVVAARTSSHMAGAGSAGSAAVVPAAALRSCAWRSKGPTDYSSNADDDSDTDSELSDDYDAGGLGVYPDTEQHCDKASIIPTPGPVLDNPLFLHNRPECN